MQITFHAPRTLVIHRKSATEDSVVVLDPPADGKASFLHGKQAAAVIFSRPQDAKGAEKVFDKALVIAEPGEYETRDIMIRGVVSKNNTIIYALEDEGITLAYLGATQQKELTEDQQDSLGNIDVLVVPIYGHNVVEARDALSLVQQIEPRIVMPLYHTSDGKADTEALKIFSKGFGTHIEETDRVKLTKKDLPQDSTHLIILKP